MFAYLNLGSTCLSLYFDNVDREDSNAEYTINRCPRSELNKEFEVRFRNDASNPIHGPLLA
jgi:hypothetical protein